MSGEEEFKKFLDNDEPLDITELASLNEDISVEFIEKLASKVTAEMNGENPDQGLFEDMEEPETNIGVQEELPQETIEKTEEPEQTQETQETQETENIVKSEPKSADNTNNDEKGEHTGLNQSIDDNFLKKYKAKLKKQTTNEEDEDYSLMGRSQPKEGEASESDVSVLSDGKIKEMPADEKQIAYNDSLDFLDNNTKYSKYVIYIDPENKEFIDSLTVKERKNLINRILKEQDNIAMTKMRFNILQSVIKHLIIAALTIVIAIPILYVIVNASLEATYDNYRRSQDIFQILYKDQGKIKNSQVSK